MGSRWKPRDWRIRWLCSIDGHVCAATKPSPTIGVIGYLKLRIVIGAIVNHSSPNNNKKNFIEWYTMKNGMRTLLGIIASLAVSVGCASLASGADNGENPTTSAATVPFISPLDKYLGSSVWRNQEEFARAHSQFVQHREDLIAQCMRSIGFEYRPHHNSNRHTIAASRFDDTQPNDRTWISQYGFGIVSGHRRDSGGSIWDELEDDPNREHLKSLTESERDAFLVALNGPSIPPPIGGFPTQAAWEEFTATYRGCFGKALVEAQSASPLFSSQTDEFAPLFAAIDDMTARIISNPEFIATNTDWSTCMSNNGHPGMSHPAEPISHIDMLFNQLQVSREISRASLRRLVTQGQLPEGITIQEQEIVLALADYDCRLETDYENRVVTIRYNLESQFVADYRSYLEAYRDARVQREPSDF